MLCSFCWLVAVSRLRVFFVLFNEACVCFLLFEGLLPCPGSHRPVIFVPITGCLHEQLFVVAVEKVCRFSCVPALPLWRSEIAIRPIW